MAFRIYSSCSNYLKTIIIEVSVICKRKKKWNHIDTLLK